MTGAQRPATYSSFEASLSPGPAKSRRASPYQPLKPNMLRPVRQPKRRNGQRCILQDSTEENKQQVQIFCDNQGAV
jgi:hypothetical protein